MLTVMTVNIMTEENNTHCNDAKHNGRGKQLSLVMTLRIMTDQKTLTVMTLRIMIDQNNTHCND